MIVFSNYCNYSNNSNIDDYSWSDYDDYNWGYDDSIIGGVKLNDFFVFGVVVSGCYSCDVVSC